MTNKTRLQEGLKIFALVFWTFCLIATCACVWNVATETKVSTFYIVTSIATFAINAIAIGFCGVKIIKHFGELSIKESQK